ncbi:MAG: portal protein [Puniceicoccaceae bacterium]|nr:MAG: portal protein [Puniceicoccaceae bacterium]
MLDADLLANLGLIVVAGACFVFLGKLIRMPSIVVYLLAGLVLGPVTGLVTLGDTLELIAEIGIALLLFLVGLELSFEKIKDVGKVAVIAGIGQVVFTAAGGFVVCWLLGFTYMESAFLAIALTFSSTVVVVKLLDQKGHLDSLYGRIAVGIFLVQDLVVIVMLTLLAGLGRGEGGGPGEVAWGLVLAFTGMGGLLLLALVASRYLLPKPFGWASRSPETIFIWSLAWCFLFVLTAEHLELSLEIGAFLAGISLAQLPYNEDLRRRVHPLMSFFIAVFFVTLGIQMDFSEARLHLGAALILSLFVLIGNPFIFMLIIAKMGYSEKTSFSTSVTVAQISEFSFIFAAMGVTSGLIATHILSITAVVGLITISASAYMILYSDPLYRLCRRLRILAPFRAGQEDDDRPPPRRSGHVIVVGMNALGRTIATRLSAKGHAVLAVDTDPFKLRDLPCDTLLGNVDYASVLEAAGLERARALISALQIEETNYLLTYRCKEFGVPCAIHAFDLSLVQDLVDLGADYLMTPKFDGIRRQNQLLREGRLEPS